MYELIVVGAGPCGIAVGIEAERRGISYLIVEQGTVCSSLTKYPIYMTFASSPENLELGGHPFSTGGDKPTRLEAIRYFRRVAEVEGLKINAFEMATSIDRTDGLFSLRTRKRDGSEHQYQAHNVAVAVGYFDHPNMLGIPGEDDPTRCTHFYTEPSAYYGMEVAVVGGKNSAVEAALQLYRAGAKVTWIYRGTEMSSSIKPWVRPEFESRIRSGQIQAMMGTQTRAINPTSITLEQDGKSFEHPNDFVFALTGYHADKQMLQQLGVTLDVESGRPVHDDETMETNVPGLYLAGVIAAGQDANKIFIENGRFHGKAIVDHLLSNRINVV